MAVKFSLTGQDIPGSDILTPGKSAAYIKALADRAKAKDNFFEGIKARPFYDSGTNQWTENMLLAERNLQDPDYFKRLQGLLENSEYSARYRKDDPKWNSRFGQGYDPRVGGARSAELNEKEAMGGLTGREKMLRDYEASKGARASIQQVFAGIGKGLEGGIDDLGETLAYMFLPDEWAINIGAGKRERSIPLPDKKPFVDIPGVTTEQERQAAIAEGRPIQRYLTQEEAIAAAKKVEEDWARGYALTRDYEIEPGEHFGDFMDYHSPEGIAEGLAYTLGTGLGSGGEGMTMDDMNAMPDWLHALEAVLPGQMGYIMSAGPTMTATKMMLRPTRTPIQIPGGGKLVGNTWTPQHFVNIDATAGYAGKVVPAGGGTQNWPGTLFVVAPSNNPFMLGTLKTTLTRNEKIFNYIADHTSLPLIVKDEFAVQVTKQLDHSKRVADNLSVSIANEYHTRAVSVFKELGESNTIRHLDGIDDTIPGAPSVQDVASRLPRYWKHLSDEEQDFFKLLRKKLAEFEDGMRELGVEISKRRDIITSGPEESRGFYIPRGNALEEGADEFVKKTKKKGGGLIDYEAKFDSMAHGVADGYEYVPLRTAIRSYILQASQKSLNKWTHTVMTTTKGADGKPLGTTPGERWAKNPTIVKYKKLQNEARSLRYRLHRSNGKLSEVVLQQRRTRRRATTAVEREEGRVTRIQERATESLEQPVRRTEAAQARVDDFVYTVDDLKTIGARLRETLKDSRDVARNMQRNLGEIKANRRKLTAAERKIQKELDKYNQLLKDADDLVARTDADLALRGELAGRTLDIPKGVAAKYRQLYRQLDKLEDRLDGMYDNANMLEEKRQELIDTGVLFKTDGTRIPKEQTETIRDLRTRSQQSRTEARLTAELDALKREEARAVKLAEKVENREINKLKKDTADKTGDAVKLDDRAARSLIEAHEIRDNLGDMQQKIIDMRAEVRSIKKEATKTPEGYARLEEFKGLQSHSFPDEMVHYMNNWMENQLPMRGQLRSTIDALYAYMRLYRGTTATADDSAFGIHGLLGAFDNPKATLQTYKAHWGAWLNHGDELFGRFLISFNEAAAKSNRLTSEQWARLDLKLGGEETEFFITGLGGRIQNLPVIKQANRAFGYYGDRLRLQWVDDALEEQLSLGKTLEEMFEDGTLAGIAKGANAATGWSNRRFAGTLGELAFYAPKFLAARLQNAGRAMKASVTDPLGAVEAVPFAGKRMRQGLTKAGLTRDIPMQDRIARRSMLRMIGSTVLLTHAINAAQGKETDMRLIKKDKITGDWIWNSDFMRIDILGRHISLLGTYDSLARLIVMSGSGIQDVMHVKNAWMGMAGGIPKQLVDFASGEDFRGRKTGQWMPGDNPLIARLGHFMSAHLPFASQELFEHAGPAEKAWEGIKQTASGEWQPAAESFAKAGANLFMEVSGGKSSPLSFTDMEKSDAVKYGNLGIKSPTAPVGGGWDPNNLSKAEKRYIRENNPEMQKWLERFSADSVGQDSAWNNIDNLMTTTEQPLIDSINAGADLPEIGEVIRDVKTVRGISWNQFLADESNKDIVAYLTKEPAHLYDYYGHKYWNIDLDDYKDFETGFIDWPQYNADKQAVLDEAYSKAVVGEKENILTYITSPATVNGSNYKSLNYGDPRVAAVVSAYDRDHEIIRSTDNRIREDFLANQNEQIRNTDLEFGTRQILRAQLDAWNEYERMPAAKRATIKTIHEQDIDPDSITDNPEYKRNVDMGHLLFGDTGMLTRWDRYKTESNEAPENWEKDTLEWKWDPIQQSPTNPVAKVIEMVLTSESEQRGAGGDFRHDEHIDRVISGIKNVMRDNPEMDILQAANMYLDLTVPEPVGAR